MSIYSKLNKNNIPTHVAIIMDGNGRWAKERGVNRFQGHIRGVNTVKKIVTAAMKLNISYLTLFTFSKENWARPKKEVSMLMDLFVNLIRTSGEKRISNFLLWQIAYSEFYFSEKKWPDFDEEELYMAIFEYQKRERRFGKTTEQINDENF